jgi:hypothetical protein
MKNSNPKGQFARLPNGEKVKILSNRSLFKSIDYLGRCQKWNEKFQSVRGDVSR